MSDISNKYQDYTNEELMEEWKKACEYHDKHGDTFVSLSWTNVVGDELEKRGFRYENGAWAR